MKLVTFSLNYNNFFDPFSNESFNFVRQFVRNKSKNDILQTDIIPSYNNKLLSFLHDLHVFRKHFKIKEISFITTQLETEQLWYKLDTLKLQDFENNLSNSLRKKTWNKNKILGGFLLSCFERNYLKTKKPWCAVVFYLEALSWLKWSVGMATA